MKLPPILFLISLLYLTTDCARKKKCRAIRGRYYSPDDGETRRCRRCEVCPAGQEWDRNATVRTSEDFGDLECLPCVACGEGYYKDNNIFMSCSVCIQNCTGLNRYLQKSCGGFVKGHCGSCKPGYEDKVGSIEMPCTQVPIVTGSHKAKEVDFSLEPLDSDSNELSPMSQTNEKTHWPIDKVIMVIGVVSGSTLVLTCLIGGFVYVIVSKRRETGKRQTNGNTAEDFSSSRRLLHSNQSVRSNQGVRSNQIPTDPERPEIIDDLDLECDTHVVPADIQVRGELQINGISIGSSEREQTANSRVQYPNTILSKDDSILATISSHVYGDDVLDRLFSRLSIPKQKCYEERQLWLNKVHTLKQFVLNVLLKWVEKAGAEATLSNLCDALRAAGCDEALNEVNKELTDR